MSSVSSHASQGIVTKASPYTVAETLERLEAAIQAKNLIVFALIGHSGEAARIGLAMNDTKLLLFGAPKGGTPLMIASPLLALDLPLKALVWQDDDGKVWASYNSTTYLADRAGYDAALRDRWCCCSWPKPCRHRPARPAP